MKSPVPSTNQGSDDSELFTIRDLEKDLKVCRRTITNLVRSKSIDVTRIGKSVRFTREAVRRFKEARTVKAVA